MARSAPPLQTTAVGVAVGVATAWGAPATVAQGSGTLEVNAEIQPTVDLTGGRLHYSVGFSAFSGIPVGPIAAGESLDVPFTSYGYPEPGYDQSYLFVGFYDDGGEPGVVVSLPADTAAEVIGNQTFDDLFADPDDGVPDHFEQDLLDTLEAGQLTTATRNKIFDLQHDFFNARPVADFPNDRFPILLDENAVLVAFSVGEAAGQILVPEPAGVFWLAGLGLCTLRRRRSPR